MPARSSSARAPARLSSPLVRRRSPRSKIRVVARWLALVVTTQQISCAGGGGASTTSTNSNVNVPTMVGVSISPASAQITAGASVQFLVTGQNASNPAVTWQVNGIPGGNSSVGTITPSGAATASYAAPASISSPLMVTVAAVLQADPTRAGSAMVTINPVPGPQITVSPANPNVVAGASQQFSVTVQNGPQAVIWEVNNIRGGNPSFGTISSSGLYTAPAQVPNPDVERFSSARRMVPAAELGKAARRHLRTRTEIFSWLLQTVRQPHPIRELTTQTRYSNSRSMRPRMASLSSIPSRGPMKLPWQFSKSISVRPG